VKTLREDGRIPLVVWDECPPLVELHAVLVKDIDWMLQQFDEEAVPRPVTLDDLGRVTLFSERYRIALRPLIECLRFVRKKAPRGDVDVEALAEDWFRLRHSEAVLGRAEQLAKLSGVGSVWARIRAVADEAEWTNVSTIPFDRMRGDDAERVLRAASIRGGLASLLSEGARVYQGAGVMYVTVLTRLDENGVTTVVWFWTPQPP
jgi:hypothetical protein